MRMIATTLELSATDLSQFLACRHLTALNMQVAEGARQAPTWVDPLVLVLRERGLEHERGYVDALIAQGLDAIDFSAASDDAALAGTLDAMRLGTNVIVQPALRNGRWFGRPDILRRVDMPSSFGVWSYEVVDTKLAKETRGGTILQLALYSEQLGIVQGTAPERFHVVTPDPAAPVHTFRVQDFAAYFRLVRGRLENFSQEEASTLAVANYPEPVEQCEVCRWWMQCDQRRRNDDHLSLVAGVSRLQSRELEANGIKTLAELAAVPLPLPFKPRRGAMETYIRVREQARVQLEGRTQQKPVHELLAIEPGQGLARLPAPSPGDIFLDLEGDPYAGDGGREYLFGLVLIGSDGSPTRQSDWAFSDSDEKTAFEAVVDQILQSSSANPGMHVYHYAPYETSAFKRLMGRYATRESEMDRMLRAEIFVDLYAIVRRGLRASVEHYSIKDLEPFYGFKRSVDLAEARTNLRIIERALELDARSAVTPEVQAAVDGYNEDDCVSAMKLRAWLEELRAGLAAGGTPVPRPEPKEGAAPEKVDERAQRVNALVAALTNGVPVDRNARTPDQQSLWLLAHLLDWHRREAKAPWWEFFRPRDLTQDELFDEKDAISGLSLVRRNGGTAKAPIDRYAYPSQDTDIRAGADLFLPDGAPFGKVIAMDRVARWIEVKKRSAQADTHPSAVFEGGIVNSDVLADALLRIGDNVAANGLASGDRYRAGRELIQRNLPRLRSGTFSPNEGESEVDFAVRMASDLDGTVLAIQGPPGAGKTFTGARMICDLVRRGARVGITAMSHKVIRNLLEAVMKEAGSTSHRVSCAHKVTEESEAPPSVREIVSNEEALTDLANGDVNVLGGTAWLWARPEAENAVDVLFVDEAGQMSLANVLATSQCADSVVLLGDPQQLEQPQQGTHPEDADVSALEHILGEHQTIPPDRGIFLPETWRLAPAISRFTSEVFYEGRLRSRAGLEHQVITGANLFDGSGLWIAPTVHEGNQNSSPEEVDVVERIVDVLLGVGAGWTNRDGKIAPMTAADILIVAPYNSQIALLEERLGSTDLRVGTVDRFQGQEAPVVIYSMATSTPVDAPRGMEFLYSLNRLNVATSRARCACILVASPRLFEPDCKSPRQMQLANALCRYVELAQLVDLV